ncbi:tRNA glutamyl-Q(34) synthetase GluQRS [Hyphococcus luteus]|uniref:tRNA glutamyl-Q(34) synthetase GluQRS n=1 Tax=Hyphococcus luteus TaxID=2058213 RepID=A0A2S7K5Y9_9PROT|nr:tRNA glutamyl-Q(34) synthetase GluQRS [Marinicaulis flavus]PQA87934.1 tRNA glutamyl-Q(34) synthetase GluQRS [Marinicaulis flavus]
MRLVTRFAPSPTGLLHLGHAFSALTVFRAAQEADGRFLLRIEDIDRTRCKPEFEEAIYEDLAWLGLDWETPVRRQSDHFGDYEAALNALREKGLVYRCFKTRKEILDEIARAPHLSAERPEGPAYVGAALPAQEERALIDDGAPFAWRLSIEAAKQYLGPAYGALSFTEETPDGVRTVKATPEIFGDPVIARKDNGTSYHLASVHDDALQSVTHVIRGEDLYSAAHLHRLLQALFDYPEPVYRHHRLLTDETGRRLAKRDKAATLQALRESGAKAEDILARLGFEAS